MAVVMSTIPNGDAIQLPPQDVTSALSTFPHVFLQPTSALHTAAVTAAKKFLDPLAHTISEAQTQRRQELRRKRKRSAYDEEEEQVLQIKQVYTAGFDTSQIWEQAKRILDAAQGEVSRGLLEIQTLKDGTRKPSDARDNDAETPVKKVVRFDGNDFDDIGDADDQALEEMDDLSGDEEGMEDLLEDEEGDDLDDDELASEDIVEDEEDIEVSDGDDVTMSKESETFVPDPNGLNDGFFSIEDFNRQSQFLEQQDELGEDDGAASDEEEIAWDMDPLAGGPQTLGNSTDEDNNEEEDESEEDGPTFGNVDLNADLDDEVAGDEDEIDEEEGLTGGSGLQNTNDIMYSDFFDPPPQKPSKTKRMRALPKTQPPKAPQGDDDISNDIQRAMSDVRRDLFDDDPSSASDSSNDDATGPIANLSTHERQRLKLMSEIRRLEAAAVAKRDWTLSGEARAVDRPVNSLIEEDLEFERTGKPVPVITAETTTSIEDLIKRRILAREFDEIIRRRPESASLLTSQRRGAIEIQDTKPQDSLSSIYESEHLRALNPESYNEKLSAATKKEHASLLSAWREISSQLDLLSNWNYKPKIPEANITTVTDAPTIMMEDVRPAAAAGMGSETAALAPQEIYVPGKEGRNGEVLLKSGAAMSKAEMTREEKLRRRRREKERGKKRAENQRGDVARQTATAAGSGGKEERRKGKAGRQEKKNIIEDLKRGGVKVIGKGGEVRDVQGRKVEGGNGGLVSSASAFKL